MRRRQDPIQLFAGGADNWDQGSAGLIVTEEFFGVRAVSAGAVMTYLGIDRGFQTITAKVWTGSAWSTIETLVLVSGMSLINLGHFRFRVSGSNVLVEKRT
jgi:hypothetical protein